LKDEKNEFLKKVDKLLILVRNSEEIPSSDEAK
jgi:hypothetical protein